MTSKAYYNKGVRAFKLGMEAFSRLRLHSLAPKIKKKADSCLYMDSITKLREAVGRNDEEGCKVMLNDIDCTASQRKWEASNGKR